MPRRRMVRFIIPWSCVGDASLGSHAALKSTQKVQGGVVRSSVRRRLFDFAHPCLWGERTIQCSLVLRRTDFEHNETLFQRIAADPARCRRTPPTQPCRRPSERPSNAADPTMPPTQRDAAERRRPKAVEPRRPNAADPKAADPTMPPTLPMAPDAAGPWETGDTDPAWSVSLAASGPPPPKRGWPCAYPPPLHPH